MNNNQREMEASNPQSQEIQELEEQLREAVIAESFFNTAVGKLWTNLVTKEITRITQEITSEKFRKDHTGYNLALSDLQAYKKILRKMQVAASPQRKAKIEERLDEKKNA